jgi:hypothetical protein
MEDSFLLKNGACFTLHKEDTNAPAQIVIIYKNNEKASKAFNDMKNQFKRFKVLKE